eukprot:1158683-Pelagomonas_calceolata.AAC.1
MLRTVLSLFLHHKQEEGGLLRAAAVLSSRCLSEQALQCSCYSVPHASIPTFRALYTQTPRTTSTLSSGNSIRQQHPSSQQQFPHSNSSSSHQQCRSLHSSGSGVLCQPSGPFEHTQQDSVVPLDKKKASSSKASDATDIRMESQCIFDACWRRFEDKYKLKSVTCGQGCHAMFCVLQATDALPTQDPESVHL